MANMANNLFNEGNNSDLLFINILNTMYNDNLRIIHHLIDQNNEIRNQIINISNERRRNINQTENVPNINVNNNNNRNNYSRIRSRVNPTSHTSHTNHTNHTNNRVIINDIPYILEEIQYISPLNTSVINENPNLETNRGRSNSLVNEIGRLVGTFFEPVTISPTQLQIEQATENIIYRDIPNPTNNSCPICLENFVETSRVTMIKHCSHVFNTESLMTWFNNNSRCPVCRFDIRNYQTNLDNRNNITENNNENINEYDNTNERETPINNRRNNTTRININNLRNNINENGFSILGNIILEGLYDLSGNSFLFNNYSGTQ